MTSTSCITSCHAKSIQKIRPNAAEDNRLHVAYYGTDDTDTDAEDGEAKETNNLDKEYKGKALTIGQSQGERKRSTKEEANERG